MKSVILLGLLFGFVPSEDDLDGPPQAWLARTPAIQVRLSLRPAWRAFEQNWPGEWSVRWDERTGTPRFLAAPGISVSEAGPLVDDIARLSGVHPAELTAMGPSGSSPNGKQYLRWSRSWKGAQVQGDEVLLAVQSGRILAVWVRLTPLRLDQPPQAGESVLVLPLGSTGELVRPGEVSVGVRAVLATSSTQDDVTTHWDRTGQVLLQYDERRFSSVTAWRETRTVDDALVEFAAAQVTVSDQSGVEETTADDGSHSLSGMLSVRLEGPELTVQSNYNNIVVSGEDDVELLPPEDLPYAATQVLASFYEGWDWLEDRWPSHPWLAEHVPAQVRLRSGTCNAYYTSGTINFFQEQQGSCNDFGRIADVVLHELGHGIHHYILAGGTFASDVSEGSSDYVSATILDDPVLAPNAYPDGSSVREIETDKVYPDDAIGQQHNDGLIWASFLWNLREQWQTSKGDAVGVQMTDTLFLGTLEQGPVLTDLYEAVIVADDDDGDLSNGTPHACELVELLDHHGLGPGPIGVVHFSHDPLGPQASDAPSYAVSFDVVDLTDGCSSFDPDSVRLWFDTSGSPLPSNEGEGDTGIDTGTAKVPSDTGVEDGSSDTGSRGAVDPEGWIAVSLEQKGNTWMGEIPRQIAGTHVRYFMEAASEDEVQFIDTHGGDEAGLFSFWVGDREELWCESFEKGAKDWTHGAGVFGSKNAPERFEDQWEFGVPAGDGVWVPDVAADGAAVAATNLSGDYSANNEQYLATPVIDLSTAGPMVLLSYERWLSVEDGVYDHAIVEANGTVLFENAATASASTALIDGAWTHQDHALETVLEDDDAVEVVWSLSSDAGLEFGGWALDDVCIVHLADLPGHYRVRDLVATDDQDTVQITWTQPWIEPIESTVLVRNADDWPTGPDDGVIIDLDTAPEAGSARSVDDLDAQPGETFYYALFASGASDADWMNGVVEGENADQGGVPLPSVDTGQDDDETSSDTAGHSGGDSDDEDETELAVRDSKDRGCGCAASRTLSGNRGWLGVLLGLVFWRRRNRS